MQQSNLHRLLLVALPWIEATVLDGVSLLQVAESLGDSRRNAILEDAKHEVRIAARAQVREGWQQMRHSTKHRNTTEPPRASPNNSRVESPPQDFWPQNSTYFYPPNNSTIEWPEGIGPDGLPETSKTGKKQALERTDVTVVEVPRQMTASSSRRRAEDEDTSRRRRRYQEDTEDEYTSRRRRRYQEDIDDENTSRRRRRYQEDIDDEYTSRRRRRYHEDGVDEYTSRRRRTRTLQEMNSENEYESRRRRRLHQHSEDYDDEYQSRRRRFRRWRAYRDPSTPDERTRAMERRKFDHADRDNADEGLYDPAELCSAIFYADDEFLGQTTQLFLGYFMREHMVSNNFMDNAVSSFRVVGKSNCLLTISGDDAFAGWHASFGPGDWTCTMAEKRGFVNDDATSFHLELLDSTTSTTFTNPFTATTLTRTSTHSTKTETTTIGPETTTTRTKTITMTTTTRTGKSTTGTTISKTVTSTVSSTSTSTTSATSVTTMTTSTRTTTSRTTTTLTTTISTTLTTTSRTTTTRTSTTRTTTSRTKTTTTVTSARTHTTITFSTRTRTFTETSVSETSISETTESTRTDTTVTHTSTSTAISSTTTGTSTSTTASTLTTGTFSTLTRTSTITQTTWTETQVALAFNNRGFEVGSNTSTYEETCDVPGWTSNSDGNAFCPIFVRSGQPPDNEYGGTDGAEGNYYLALRRSGASIAQRVWRHIVGAPYKLDFYIAKRGLATGDPVIEVTIQTVGKFNFNATSREMSLKSVPYVAHEKHVYFKFKNVGPNSFNTIFIDKITITESVNSSESGSMLRGRII